MYPKPIDKSKPIVKLIIAGSRSLDSKREQISESIRKLVSYLSTNANVVIVNGLAPKGPDHIGGEVAEEMGLWQIFMPADWDGKGKIAGHLRNGDMAKEGHYLTLYWDGESNGSRTMLNYALLEGCKVTEVVIKGDSADVTQITKGHKQWTLV